MWSHACSDKLCNLADNLGGGDSLQAFRKAGTVKVKSAAHGQVLSPVPVTPQRVQRGRAHTGKEQSCLQHRANQKEEYTDEWQAFPRWPGELELGNDSQPSSRFSGPFPLCQRNQLPAVKSHCFLILVTCRSHARGSCLKLGA